MTIDRDRSIDQLLRQSRPPAAAPATPCLEPETVAAWLDGSLSSKERAAVEAHAAACERCQAVVAVTMQSGPPAAEATSLRAPFIRWMAPLALAEAALLAWMIIAPRNSPVPAAPAPAAEAATSIARFQAPPELSGGAPAAARPQQPNLEANLRRSKQDGEAPKAKEQLKDERAAALAPPPAALAMAPLEKRADLDAKTNADAGPAPERSQRKAAEPLREAAAIAAPALTITSPDPAVRWRVTSPGRVDRSVDGGVTWTPQDVGGAVTIRAGKSISTDVAWLVGNDGVVLVSADGRTWQRRDIGEAVALVDVNPIDARTASVTAADGRRFTTRDGGATWIRTTPQENPPAPF